MNAPTSQSRTPIADAAFAQVMADRLQHDMPPAMDVEIEIPPGDERREVADLVGTDDPGSVFPTARAFVERRADHALRNLVLVSNIMAHKLAQFDLEADNDFARELKNLLQAHELAVAGVRRAFIGEGR